MSIADKQEQIAFLRMLLDDVINGEAHITEISTSMAHSHAMFQELNGNRVIPRRTGTQTEVNLKFVKTGPIKKPDNPYVPPQGGLTRL